MSKLAICVSVLSHLFTSATTIADQPDPQPQRTRITYEDLRALGQSAYAINDLLDNKFMYKEAKLQVERYARKLEGMEIVWTATVVRVTFDEVLLHVDPAGRTQIAFVRKEQDRFAHSFLSRHRDYPGPPSTLRYNFMSSPKTLRIGRDVRLEDAKKFRQGDIITLVSDVHGVDAFIPSAHLDDIVVFLNNVRVYYDDPNWFIGRVYAR